MTEILLLKFAHIVGFAYWLGTDLGVFYSSYFAADRKLPASTRLIVIKILFALDMAPRICMTLMLPIGIHLAYRLGLLPLPAIIVPVAWGVCLAWLANVLYLHYGRNGPAKPLLTRVDFWFRVVMVIILAAYAALSLFGNGGTPASWLALKILIFAVMMSCGLLVRLRLKDFGPAFARLAQGAATEQDEIAISQGISSTRPFVMVIWLGLFASAALGLHLV